MKKLFISIALVCLTVFFSSPLFSQSIPRKVTKGQESWRALIKAQNAFDAGDFGLALHYAEESRSIRKQDAAWQLYVIENTLKRSKVRKAGDFLESVIPVLKEEELNDALEVVNFFLDFHGEEFFDGKYSKILEYISYYSHDAEADYLVGKIYALEGEYDIALKYWQSAYEYILNLKIPMVKFDLLYELASLSRDLGRTDDFEKYLLLVVKDDEYFRNDNFMNALSRTINADKNTSVEKFFLLYRYKNDIALRAFIDLSEFYFEDKQTEKAVRCSALASILAVTKIQEILEERITGYEYSTFEDLLSKCSEYSDIVEWGNKNKIWKHFCDFGDITLMAYKTEFATELYSILARNEPEEYWKMYASKRMNNFLAN